MRSVYRASVRNCHIIQLYVRHVDAVRDIIECYRLIAIAYLACLLSGDELVFDVTLRFETDFHSEAETRCSCGPSRHACAPGFFEFSCYMQFLCDRRCIVRLQLSHVLQPISFASNS